MSIRTCLVTGKKIDSKTLFRFTVQKGVLVFDKSFKNKNLGRGGYVEISEKSLEKLNFLGKKVAYFLKEDSVLIQKNIIEKQKKNVLNFT